MFSVLAVAAAFAEAAEVIDQSVAGTLLVALFVALLVVLIVARRSEALAIVAVCWAVGLPLRLFDVHLAIEAAVFVPVATALTYVLFDRRSRDTHSAR